MKVIVKAIPLSIVALLLCSSLASAQDPIMQTRFGLFGSGQFIGEARTELEDNNGADRTDDLDPTWGGGAYFEFPVSSAFSVTTEASGHAWRLDTGGDPGFSNRNVFVDFTFAPRLRAPTGDRMGNGGHVIFFLDFPLGFTLSVLDDEYNANIQGANGDTSIGYGLHGGARAGAQIFFSRSVGLTLDGGILFRGVRHQVDGPLGTDLNLDIGSYQITARAGLVFTTG